MAVASTQILHGNIALSPMWRRYFPEPFLLRQLRAARLPVIRFALTHPAMYREYRKTGRIAPAAIEQFVAASGQDRLSKGRRLVVRCPFADENAPLPEPASVRLNATAICGVIESFYRAWDGEKFEHYRTVEAVPERVAPLLMLHGDYGATGLAFSRSPRTGQKTNEANWEAGLVGAVARLTRQASSALGTAEKSLRFPVTIAIINSPQKNTFKICGVRRLEMTAECSLRALIEMLENREISLAEFLAQIDVSWFRGGTIFRVRPPSFQAVGLPACAGAAFAPAYLRPLGNAPVPHGGIFVVMECSPNDLPMILASQAVVSTRGGISSHAAMICRQLGKPCVCGASALEIDYPTRTIRASKMVAAEGTLCMMNGTTGEVALLVGGVDTVTVADALASNTAEHLKILRALIGKLPHRQTNRLATRKAEMLTELQSLFDLLDEP